MFAEKGSQYIRALDLRDVFWFKKKTLASVLHGESVGCLHESVRVYQAWRRTLKRPLEN